MRAQVVLIHEGESVKGQAGAGCDDGSPGAKLGGRIKEIAERAVPAVDLIVSGHSHFSYECTVNDPAGHRRLVPQGADLALMNPGSMRADLVFHDGGAVTYADAYRVQPFESPLWVLPVTGPQLLTALRQQFTGANADSPRFLRLSEQLAHSVDMSRTGADRLLADTVRIDGRPLSPDTTHKVAPDEFLANGGNGFTVFGDITAREGGEVTDLNTLVTHLETTTSATSPAAPPAPRTARRRRAATRKGGRSTRHRPARSAGSRPVDRSGCLRPGRTGIPGVPAGRVVLRSRVERDP
ncbi:MULTISPECIES: bifunctional metallophosphatase/5'-nucleotidase [Streptomyces]|uniref:5'-Nucleotidase C-terminal domain-containing protein n=1 Tax=Streptomyces viridochromogenes TaxID=1938 RepID=A0A0L8LEZ7_STRVR|nr:MULTISPECIES: 5'-nucleotidase [Streptomyces]KOG36679.1 hypothetical protein ADK34_00055 [Streptomyces viridochromogenes]